MTTYNTGNPIGSTDARDLYDNAQNLDNFANGTAASYTDRLGVSRRSLAGIDSAADNVLNAIGYSVPVAYAGGISLTLTSQTVDYNGVIYAPKSSALPFTTSSWGADSAKFRAIQVTDADLITYTPAGTGAVATNVQSKLREMVSVKDFGADPAASAAVNTAAIQAAADYANSIGAKLIGAPGTFTVNATISLNCNGDLGDMTIEADCSVVSPIVRFGTTAGTPTSRKIITLPRVRNNARAVGTWGAGVGIELANCNNNTIVVPSATECEIGLLCGGYNSGFAYNNVTLMNVYSNKINLKLTTLGSTGWCNQNTFIGGRLGANTADFTTSGYTGTRQILLSKGATSSAGPNTNTFLGTSIETNNYEYMVAFDQSASANQFITCRYEGTNQKVLFATNISSGITTNSFIGGYQVEFLQFTYSGTGSSAYNGIISPRRTDISGTGVTLNLTNGGGATVASPHIQGFEADKSALGQSASATDWRYRLYADGLSFKEAAESYDKVTIYSGQTGNPSILLGQGLAAPDRGLSLVGTSALVLETPITGGAVRNNVDNQTTLGSGTYRWSVVYAGTGTINTSDEREKQDIDILSSAELRVASALKGLIKKFRFKDAVVEKGNDARIHVGVIAQEVMAAFQAEGLDPTRYGIICYDEWESEESKPAGNRYGVRYDELLAFIISAL